MNSGELEAAFLREKKIREKQQQTEGLGTIERRHSEKGGRSYARGGKDGKKKESETADIHSLEKPVRTHLKAVWGMRFLWRKKLEGKKRGFLRTPNSR